MSNAKKWIMRAALAASFAGLAGTAQAVPTQVCFRLDPFVDILKIVRSDPLATHRSLHGTWIAPGFYTIPVSGASELEAGSVTTKKIGLVGTNSSTAFGDNLICGLTGISNQPWELNCTGGTGASFQNSGSSLTVISCVGLPPSLAVGRAAGVK